jgi:hypothetical protein
LFSGISPGVRGAVAGAAGTALLGLLACWAPLLLPVALLALLAGLHGYATSCPACGRWWARAREQTEFVDREVFDKDGVLVGRSVYRTTYGCRSCGHSWSVSYAEESPEPERPRRWGRP